MVDQDSVSRQSGLQPNAEMSIVGYVVAAGSLLLFLPLAPFLAVLWVFDRLTGSDPGDRAAERTERQVVEPSEQDRESRRDADLTT